MSGDADICTWLGAKRDAHAALREEAFQANDFVKANRHAEWADRLAEALISIEAYRKKQEAFTEVLQGRIIVALNEAKAPPWKPTHRHYKGTLYRVTGVRQDVNEAEAVECIEYDDGAGNRFVLKREKFESLLDSGKPRYQTLYGMEGEGER